MNEITFANWQDLSMQAVSQDIYACQLWQGENGAKAFVVKIEPGGKWQGFDVHETGSEEIFVVSGTFNDGDRDYSAGTFIHNPIGSKHIPQSKLGCTLFVFNP